MPYPGPKFFPGAVYPGTGSSTPAAESSLERTQELVKRLPPFMRRDPTVLALLHVAANEFTYLEAVMDEVIANYYPQTADVLLSFWERLFRLPVAPPEKSNAQRRETVVTFLRRMSDGGRGENWIARLRDLAGSNWVYATNTPTDIKGLIWERFLGEVGTSWEWLSGSGVGYTFADPSGLIPQATSVHEFIYPTIELIDQESLIQFTTGGKAAGEEIAAVVKHVSSGKELRAKWANDELILQKVSGGTATEITKVAASLTVGKKYWLRAWIEDNTFKAQIWESDPSKNNGASSKYSKETTLAGENATNYGTGVKGSAGVYWSGLDTDWLVRQVRVNEVGIAVPDNTIRVTIPYEEGSYQALEFMLLARSITPANTDIEVFNDLGFVLGISKLGVQGF